MSASSKKDIVIITDVGSVDIDDVLTLCMLPKMPNLNVIGIIACHFYCRERAKIIKLILGEIGLGHVPVYVGHGIGYSDVYVESHRKQFLADNDLFPKVFGLPGGVYDEGLGEKQWFPNFMKAYHEIYGKEFMDKMPIESKSGSDFLVETLSKYSASNRLTIVSIGPMHDLALVQAELYTNMNLYVMGGGFGTTDTDGVIRVNKLGYNWGICPKITQIVLEKLSSQSNYLTLIGSDFVRKVNVSIPLDIYNTWQQIMETSISIVPNITRAIMLDWLYCNKGNKLSQHKNLCDPLTLYLAMTENYSAESYEATIRDDYKISSYLEETPDMMIMEPNISGNVQNVIGIPYDVNARILHWLDDVLFSEYLTPEAAI